MKTEIEMRKARKAVLPLRVHGRGKSSSSGREQRLPPMQRSSLASTPPSTLLSTPSSTLLSTPPSTLLSSPLSQAQDVLKKIDDHLRRTGGRMTGVRREIVLKMAELGTAHTAYQILEAANKKRKSKLSAISLYRTLDFLIEAGFALKLESKNAFELCLKDELPHSHLVMICDTCGRAREIEDHELAEAIAQRTRQYGHTLKHHAIELHGTCKAC